MPFASGVFLAFLACSLVLYTMLARRWQNALLLVASYVFYGWLDWRFCLLLLAATAIAYGGARGLARSASRPATRRWILAASIAALLGILATFKYLDFFIASAADLLTLFGFEAHPKVLGLLLPVGISFYTFCLVGLLVDTHRGTVEPVKDPITFGLFASFYPQILSGPIARASHLMPQLQRTRAVTGQHLSEGLELIFIGLVRKVAVADIILPHVKAVFAGAGDLPAGTLWAGFYLYGLLIYCDFAGYSEMARGVARLFGFDLAQNFLQPYFSRSFSEFWRRWHISLGHWLRDYLYIPLGGSRRGLSRTCANLFITMLLCGLWHDAGLTFIAWGAFHGLMLVVERLGRAVAPGRPRPWLGPIRMALVFHLVLLAWVFFESKTFGQASGYVAGMLSKDWGAWTFHWVLVAYAAGITLLIDIPQAATRNLFVIGRLSFAQRIVATTAGVGLLILCWSSEYAPFIYSQF